MPLSQDPTQRGNLILTFNIQFPVKLSPERKQLIKQALANNKMMMTWGMSLANHKWETFFEAFLKLYCWGQTHSKGNSWGKTRWDFWQEIMTAGCLYICGSPSSEPVSAARTWRTSPHSRSPVVRRTAWTFRAKKQVENKHPSFKSLWCTIKLTENDAFLFSVPHLNIHPCSEILPLIKSKRSLFSHHGCSAVENAAVLANCCVHIPRLDHIHGRGEDCCAQACAEGRDKVAGKIVCGAKAGYYSSKKSNTWCALRYFLQPVAHPLGK